MEGERVGTFSPYIDHHDLPHSCRERGLLSLTDPPVGLLIIITSLPLGFPSGPPASRQEVGGTGQVWPFALRGPCRAFGNKGADE